MSDAELRYDQFIERISGKEELWVLSDGESFALLNSDGEDCLPLWADAESARLWSNDPALVPREVPLAAWFERWVPGLTADNIMVAVNPGESGDAVVLSAEELVDAMLPANG
ncbi:DUF2750 domain-containing protein [Alcanivorax sp. 1008]|uniref:DUF2750 domain-containing protein n=1 Tax=Alcanivorax sp. 1008 TaxID=2816853 RepID=UPI001D7DB306|nr:DUF2750 domain-containing protein [Alcanivorax sp. 1008]MCC1496163.1 DUF2750 domain-containing protein [Alcanivorax sp. 1008]